ncbi:MAG: C39 family peptidase [Burkholderiales bacterium]
MGAHIHFDRPGSPRLHDMPVTVPRLPRAKLSKAGEFRLPIQTLPQPDETTCGPTCLHAVYSYWGEHEPLDQVIARNYRMQHGGTFAVFLACDALRQGYRATIYTYNLMVFDPTWFAKSGVNVAERLQRQREIKMDARLQEVTPGYLEFLSLGGRLRFVDLSPTLLHKILGRGFPIITGLSSTYLYHNAREYGPNDTKDDVRGFPSGHFVVIAGYDTARRRVLVVDPYQPHPYGSSHEYWISIDRAVGAILLGIVTHDANLLVIHPPARP